jgi:hypothetical protein
LLLSLVFAGIVGMLVRWTNVETRRKIGRSREEARREREADERENGLGSSANPDYDDDDDMQL